MNATAGQLGGAIGGGLVRGGAIGGARGGARGGAAGARMQKTVVEERGGVAPGTRGDILDRVAAALPRARTLANQADLTRLTVPLGRTGLQQIVVDLVFGPPSAPTASDLQVRLRAYGKEGLLSRRPTATVADQVWTAVGP